ncbi:hypothetical protein ES703_48252 [subsurface metagenome]
MKESPKVRGIFGLISAITYSADSAIGLTISILIPKLQYPYLSGGLT